jgi:hypothetical protein
VVDVGDDGDIANRAQRIFLMFCAAFRDRERPPGWRRLYGLEIVVGAARGTHRRPANRLSMLV